MSVRIGAHPHLPIFLRCNTRLVITIISIRKQLTIQNKISVSYILNGGEFGSVPVKSALSEMSSPSEPGGCGGIPLLSKLNFFERSWKSALRFSAISSNAARCALTNVKVIGAGEYTANAPSEGGVKERRMAVPPLFP